MLDVEDGIKHLPLFAVLVACVKRVTRFTKNPATAGLVPWVERRLGPKIIRFPLQRISGIKGIDDSIARLLEEPLPFLVSVRVFENDVVESGRIEDMENSRLREVCR